MIRDLLYQIRQMQEDAHQMQIQQMKNLVEQGDGERLGPVKALDWMTYKPAALFHPVRAPLVGKCQVKC